MLSRPPGYRQAAVSYYKSAFSVAMDNLHPLILQFLLVCFHFSHYSMWRLFIQLFIVTHRLDLTNIPTSMPLDIPSSVMPKPSS